MDLWDRLAADPEWMAGIYRAADIATAFALSYERPGEPIPDEVSPGPPERLEGETIERLDIGGMMLVPADVDASDEMLTTVATEMIRQEVERRLKLRRRRR